MSGTRARPRVHYNPAGVSRPEDRRPIRGQCGEYIDDPARITSEWQSVPVEDRCIRCTKSLARTDIRARLDRIIYAAEHASDGVVPADLILTIGKAD